MNQPDTISMTEVIAAAAALGVTDVPSVSKLTSGRVWPAGNGWVAELGQVPAVHAIDVFPSEDDARAAVVEAIEQARTGLAERLRTGGPSAAALADERPRWKTPSVSVEQRTSEARTHR
ncbi:MAG: hypothetical protein ACRDT6_16410 [Micromonosporaceae bacterium]